MNFYKVKKMYEINKLCNEEKYKYKMLLYEQHH